MKKPTVDTIDSQNPVELPHNVNPPVVDTESTGGHSDSEALVDTPVANQESISHSDSEFGDSQDEREVPEDPFEKPEESNSVQNHVSSSGSEEESVDVNIDANDILDEDNSGSERITFPGDFPDSERITFPDDFPDNKEILNQKFKLDFSGIDSAEMYESLCAMGMKIQWMEWVQLFHFALTSGEIIVTVTDLMKGGEWLREHACNITEGEPGFATDTPKHIYIGAVFGSFILSKILSHKYSEQFTKFKSVLLEVISGIAVGTFLQELELPSVPDNIPVIKVLQVLNVFDALINTCVQMHAALEDPDNRSEYVHPAIQAFLIPLYTTAKTYKTAIAFFGFSYTITNILILATSPEDPENLPDIMEKVFYAGCASGFISIASPKITNFLEIVERANVDMQLIFMAVLSLAVCIGRVDPSNPDDHDAQINWDAGNASAILWFLLASVALKAYELSIEHHVPQRFNPKNLTEKFVDGVYNRVSSGIHGFFERTGERKSLMTLQSARTLTINSTDENESVIEEILQQQSQPRGSNS